MITKSTTVCMVSDIHIPHHMPDEWRAFRLWHAETRPAKTIIAGDFLDLAPLSTFTPDPADSIRVIPEIQEFVREANALADECGELHIIEGNHEARWARSMKDIAARLYGAVGLTLREQCLAQGMHKHIQWHVEDQHWRGLDVAQMLIRHGHNDAGRFGGGEYIAGNLMKKTLGRSMTVGHHHTVQLHTKRNDRGELIQVSCNGTFEKPAGFAPNNPWVYGFTIYELCSPAWCTVHPIIIEKGVFAYGGKVYDGRDAAASRLHDVSDVPLPSKPPYPAYFPGAAALAQSESDSIAERLERLVNDMRDLSEGSPNTILDTQEHDYMGPRVSPLPLPPPAPREERNTRGAINDRTRIIRHPVTGVTQSLSDWARAGNMSRNTLTYRLDRVARDPSYTLEMALAPKTPPSQ